MTALAATERETAARGPAPRVLPVDPASHVPQAMHGPDRHWPETNCYADLWIEVLGAMGLAPEAAFGFTIAQDFEGDQFTFFKPPLDDLEALYGLRVTELSLYDDLLAHIAQQLGRGRLVAVELDSFFLPDTRGVAYRETHGKTTVAINRLDRAGRSIDYFHNGGVFHADGADFDGLFGRLPDQARDDRLFPYAETIRPPEHRPEAEATRETARALLARHLARRPAENPVAAFRAVALAQAEALAEREPQAFHLYAFNTLRQLGANFELLATHLDWLDRLRFEAAIASAASIAEGAKVAQYGLARALRQRRFERFDASLEPLIAAHEALIAALLDARG